MKSMYDFSIEPISMADKTVFEQCRDGFYESLGSENHISDLCFSNLLAWSDSFKTRRTLKDGFYCVSVEHKGQWYRYAPIGKIDGQFEVYESILGLDCQNHVELIMVPEVFLPVLQGLKNYEIEYSYDPAYSDYIYDNTSFLRILEKQSNRCDYNHFKRNHVSSFQIIDKQNRADCLKVMERYWCSRRDCGSCHFGC